MRIDKKFAHLFKMFEVFGLERFSNTISIELFFRRVPRLHFKGKSFCNSEKTLSVSIDFANRPKWEICKKNVHGLGSCNY